MPCCRSCKWIGFDDTILYAIFNSLDFDQGKILYRPDNGNEACAGIALADLARHGDVRTIRPRLGLVVAGLQSRPQLPVQIIEGARYFCAPQPGDPWPAEKPLAIQLELKCAGIDATRLDLQAIHLPEINIADEMQRQVQICARYSPRPGFKRDSASSFVQLLPQRSVRPQREKKSNILSLPHR